MPEKMSEFQSREMSGGNSSNLLPVLGLDVDQRGLVVLVALFEHNCCFIQLSGGLQHCAQVAIELTVVQFKRKLHTPVDKNKIRQRVFSHSTNRLTSPVRVTMRAMPALHCSL